MPFIPIYRIQDHFHNDFGTHVTKADGRLHQHDYWEMFYVISGCASHRLENSNSVFSSGTLYLLKPYHTHAFYDTFDKVAIHRDIALSDELFRQTCNSISEDFYDTFVSSPQKLFTIPIDEATTTTLEKRLDNFCSIPELELQQQKIVSRMICNFILLLFFENRILSIRHDSDQLNRIIETMKKPEVLQFGIEYLLNEVGFSHGYLCRLFRKQTGKTILETLTSFRMQYASNLIRNSNFTFLDISERVGYDSLSHFVKVFKQYYHQTPSEYKRKFATKTNLTKTES